MQVKQRNGVGAHKRYAGPILHGHFQVMEHLFSKSYHVVDLHFYDDADEGSYESPKYIEKINEMSHDTVLDAEAFAARLAAYTMTGPKNPKLKPMAEILQYAWDKGFYLAILYEMEVGKTWHARFERREVINNKPRTRDGAYCRTANEALQAAADEIEFPGINEKRRQGNIQAHWDKIRGIRHLDEDPMHKDGRPKPPKDKKYDAYELEKFLVDRIDLLVQLEVSLQALIMCYDPEAEDEGDWI